MSEPRIHVPARSLDERTKPKPLSRTERTVVLAAALYIRQKGQAPTWGELRRAIGVPHGKFKHVMHGLRRKGLVSFKNGVERSLEVHPHAVTQALAKRRAK